MFIPSAIINPTETEITVIEGGQYRLDKFRLGEYVLMQFTGLKDSKGKEIYEGDVVKFIEENLIGEIRYQDDAFVMGGLGIKSAARFPEKYKIIGNIYENPELCKP